MARKYELITKLYRDIQKEVIIPGTYYVWRNTLLAYEVGAGKTFEMVAAAMEMLHLL